ncbi:MAG: class B sortase, partial [Clostridia bacterium]|nr:class B sortase [Clostridia bacterium]
MKIKNKSVFILIIALLLVIAIIIGTIVWNLSMGNFNSDKFKTSSGEINITVSNNSDDLPRVENPINFNELEKENEDIHGWITIPNTKIDYPIVQSYSEDDLFYIDHDINKEKAKAGAIFTQKLNQRDFTDPNTLIYGHNMANGTMFRHLHKFKNKSFFEENQYFYIYTRGH